MTSPTPTDSESLDLRDKFADVDLVDYMASLGFEYSEHKPHGAWFTKDEGTSEITIFGAREMRALIEAEIAKRETALLDSIEARIDPERKALSLFSIKKFITNKRPTTNTEAIRDTPEERATMRAKMKQVYKDDKPLSELSKEREG